MCLRQGLGGLHKWMIDNTENGNITRQEAGESSLMWL